MKALKQTTLALCLVLAYGVASASQTSARLSMPLAINAYIDAVSYGKTDNLEEIIDNRAVFTIQTGNSARSYDKKAIISLIKGNQTVQQNCETSFKVLDSDEKHATIKVMYKYETFVRVDNVSMIGNKNGWKITKVSTSFV